LKKEAKTFDPNLSTTKLTKFFGSFFQKRTPSFLLCRYAAAAAAVGA
jgi:hypothetical protein